MFNKPFKPSHQAQNGFQKFNSGRKAVYVLGSKTPIVTRRLES